MALSGLFPDVLALNMAVPSGAENDAQRLRLT